MAMLVRRSPEQERQVRVVLGLEPAEPAPADDQQPADAGVDDRPAT